MTINNIQAFIGGLWDWAILDGCFGNTRIKPADSDGIVERNGLLLILEAKGPNVELPTGQRIMFANLAKRGTATTIVVWGDPGQPTHYMVFHKRQKPKRKPCNLAILRRAVSNWYKWADSPENADTLRAAS